LGKGRRGGVFWLGANKDLRRPLKLICLQIVLVEAGGVAGGGGRSFSDLNVSFRSINQLSQNKRVNSRGGKRTAKEAEGGN